MTTPYLDLPGFRGLTIMPSGDVDLLEATVPGWISIQLVHASRWIDSRLAKRYEAPFASPFPEAVGAWLARIVTLRAFLKRGVNPTDAQFVEIKADADQAVAEIKEAADSEDGLFDLPLRADTSSSGISRGGPRVYSEASPYVWTDLQVDMGRDEDRARTGTRG